MNKKMLVGLFAILGLVGMGFAFDGFDGEKAFDREAIKGNMEECREYFHSEEALALIEEMRSAREAGDFERMEELRAEMKENTPEGCAPQRMRRGMRIINSLPEDVQEEFRQAHENQDFEALKALKEEYLPGHCERCMKECGMDN